MVLCIRVSFNAHVTYISMGNTYKNIILICFPFQGRTTTNTQQSIPQRLGELREFVCQQRLPPLQTTGGLGEPSRSTVPQLLNSISSTHSYLCTSSVFSSPFPRLQMASERASFGLSRFARERRCT
jgi:hypothetical protein